MCVSVCVCVSDERGTGHRIRGSIYGSAEQEEAPLSYLALQPHGGLQVASFPGSNPQLIFRQKLGRRPGKDG